jgi:hypothetical protein
MKTNWVVWSTTALLLAACSGGGGSNNNTYGIPQTLNQRSLSQATPLSVEQTQNLKSVLGSAKDKLPDSDVFFAKKKESEEQARRDKINKFNRTQSNIYNLVRNNCSIVDSEPPDSSDSVPAEGSQTVQTTTQTISGSDCPISYKNQSTQTTTILKSNAPEIINEIKANPRNAEAAINKLETYVQVDIDGNMISDITSTDLLRMIDGAVQTAQVGGRFSGTVHTQGLTATEVYMKSKDYKVQMMTTKGLVFTGNLELEMLKKGSRMQSYIGLSMAIDGVQVELQIMTDGNSQKYYLNGVSMSKQQIDDIFGDLASNATLTAN